MKQRWVVRGVLLFLLCFANLNQMWSPDVVPNGLLSWTLLRQGNVDYDEFAIDRETYFFRACGVSTATAAPALPRSGGGPPPPGPADHVCSIFPPGIGLLALPFYAPFVLAGAAPDDAAVLLGAGHAVAALLETIAALLLWSLALRFVPARTALLLTLLYLLGTSVRTVGSQALWQHAGVHAAVAFALWQTLRAAVRPRHAAFAGLALGFGAVVRQTTALVAPAIVAASPRAATLGLITGLLPLLAYNVVAFGSPFEQGYGAKPLDPGAALTGVHGLLLSPSRGLLVYEPWVVAAIASLALAWRRTGPFAVRLRWLGLSALALLLLYATYAEWWGGRVFGPRFLDDLAPVTIAALAWGIGQGLLAGRLRPVLFAAAAGWSVVLFGAAALVYGGRWDLAPVNVNFAPARLFDWGDPQWLAVLRDVPGGGPRVLAAILLSALLLALLARWESRSLPVSSRP